MASTNTRFQVFEFDDDDNGVEHYKFYDRLGIRKTKKKREDSPITKYHFLQKFAAGDTKTKDRDKGNPIDVDAEVVQKAKPQEQDCTELVDVDATDGSSSPLMFPNAPLEDTPDKVQISRLDASTHKIQPVVPVSSKMRSPETTSSATSLFCTPKNQVSLEKQLMELECWGCEIDNENMTVKIFPGFIIYQDISLGEPCLIFSSNNIKLEGYTLDGTGKAFRSEWDNSNVMKIESDWNAPVATAMVCLYLRPKKSKRSGKGSKTSGVEKLIFAVHHPHWYTVQEAITNLNGRYRDKWNIESGMVSGEKEYLDRSCVFSSKQGISSSDKPLLDVIYPKGDPDAIVIHQRDIELLEPKRFINDTIIDFYIKYLASNLQPEKKHRFHFFNSFFFRKLADLDKDRSSAYEGKAAFQRVRKWTRKAYLFEKDYLFVPVNYSLHWSLLVICFPGEVPNSEDEESENASKVPCILHMDSLSGSHKGLKNLIRSYLSEEWKEKHNDTTQDISSKFLHMKFLPLELPQQENLFDCGLFLLHYVERFLEEAPLNIAKFSNVLSRNWFLPEEASHKRYQIKKLIHKLIEDHSQDMRNADSIDRDPCWVQAETCDEESEVVLVAQLSGSTKKQHGFSPSCNVDLFGESLSESKDDAWFGKSGLVSLEFSEQGACSNSSTDANYPHSPTTRHRIHIRIEEAEEIDEHVPESSLDKGNCEEVSIFDEFWKHGVYSVLDSPMHIDENVSEPLLYVEDSEEEETAIKAAKEIQLPKTIEQCEQGNEACVVGNLDKELINCVVKDSDDEDIGCDRNKLGCFQFSRKRSKRRLSSKLLFHSR